MLLFDLFLASICVYVSFGCDIEAPLPKPYPPLDFDKAEGTWYLTVTSLDNMAMDMDCMKVENIHSTRAGFADLATAYYNGNKISFRVDVKLTEDGYFQQKSIDHNEDIATRYYANGNINPKAVSEQHEVQWDKFTFLGDFNRYFAYVDCASTGWIVWVYTKEMKITTENLAYIQNDLLKQGVSAPFRLGRCESVIEK